jgi:endonuclease/exonuclease/phosphatase family metal-dependent hydrolase
MTPIPKLFRTAMAILTAMVVALVVFYFWASSANHKAKDYAQLITNNYPFTEKNDSLYSIITYNIGYLSGLTNNLPATTTKTFFTDNLTSVYNEFDKLKADIICFQEIDYHSKRSFYINQQEELQKLGYNYVFKAVNWDKKYLPFPYFPLSAHYGEIYSGQAVFSKYPLRETERIVLARVTTSPFYRAAFYIDRLALVCKTTIAGKPVVIINVHLEAFDYPTRFKQVKHVIEIYNRYQDKFPVLLVGDFNSDLTFNNPAIQMIFDLPGIKSATHDQEKTFPSVSPVKKLDYIFYNEKFIEFKSSQVLTSFGQASDHLPVLLEFKIK